MTEALTEAEIAEIDADILSAASDRPIMGFYQDGRLVIYQDVGTGFTINGHVTVKPDTEPPTTAPEKNNYVRVQHPEHGSMVCTTLAFSEYRKAVRRGDTQIPLANYIVNILPRKKPLELEYGYALYKVGVTNQDEYLRVGRTETKVFSEGDVFVLLKRMGTASRRVYQIG